MYWLIVQSIFIDDAAAVLAISSEALCVAAANINVDVADLYAIVRVGLCQLFVELIAVAVANNVPNVPDVELILIRDEILPAVPVTLVTIHSTESIHLTPFAHLQHSFQSQGLRP